MDQLIIEQVIADQREMVKRKNRGIKRFIDFSKHLKSKQISVISGVRRSGKSTLLMQLTDMYKDFHFITFDDERLADFGVSDFNSLMIALENTYHSKTLFFDEIQNVTGWERFVRRLHDQEFKVFISGSNSKLLSSELATHLTGRYIKTELFPFSFAEYLTFFNIDKLDKTTANLGRITGAFNNYMSTGGFPEMVLTGEQEYLMRIYEDIIYRDLIVRFGIKNTTGFKNLVRYLFTNFTKETNYNSLAGVLGFSSTTSVRDYVSFLSESYLISELYRYDNSLKRQYQSNKKIYVIDNGLRNAVSFRTGQDTGRMLENMVYTELKRRGKECWFYKTRSGLEVDFLHPDKKTDLLQVCYDLTDPATLKRETAALSESMTELGLKESGILSYNERYDISTKAGTIHVIPAWEWLLT